MKLGKTWTLIWLLFAMASAGWWWLMPGGFPVESLRFWSNSVIPLAALSVALAAAVIAWRGPARWHEELVRLPPLGCFWVGILALLIFPVSGTVVAFFLLPSGLMLAWLAWRAQHPPVSFRWQGLGIVLGAGLTSLVLVLAQRGADPDTRPLNEPLPALQEKEGPLSENIVLNDRVRLLPNGPMVEIQQDGLTIEIQPVLTFFSRSPDRCWTVFNAFQHPQHMPRRLTGRHVTASGAALRYEEDYVSTLQISSEASTGNVEVVAHSHLEEDVFSHLNTWCHIEVRGHRELGLGFSPCPGQVIPVRPFGHRSGEPLRFAYVDQENQFHVAQARRGDKGPFQELATGHLGVEEELTIVLYDRDQPRYRLVFADWSRQAGRVLSPTAGWGVAENAIAFACQGRSCSIWLSLAATSVGRGWDTVGHAAGTYRNRLRIERVMAVLK